MEPDPVKKLIESAHTSTSLIPLTCRLGWHKWERWSEFKGYDVRDNRTFEVIGYALIQTSTCRKCGLVKSRTLFKRIRM